MIIFLHGPDSYRRAQKSKQLIAAYLEKHSDTSPRHFDLAEPEGVEALKRFIGQKSLFFDAHLGVIKNLFAAPLAELLKNNLSRRDLTLIVVEDNKSPADYEFLLERPIVAHSFEYLEGQKLMDFLRNEAVMRGLSLDNQFFNRLIMTYGSDLWGSCTELDRLALSSPAQHDKIAGYADKYDFFGLLNGLRSGILGKRLFSLEILLNSSEEPAKIFNILSAGRFGKTRFADYDIMIKSGKLDYEEVLSDFVL